jgi:Melibiase
MAKRHTITFDNGLSLELACDGQRFLGIAAVRYEDTPLRSPKLPWNVYTESEHGFRFDQFRLKEVTALPDRATIVFTSEGSWLPRIQAADAMGDARFKTRRLRPPVATFYWHFRPITEQIAENQWTGLEMQLEVRSPGQPIHWMLEDTTWEIGGNASGAVLIQQDVSAIDLEQHVKAESAFSTIEKFFTQGDGAWGGSYPMDMLPRAAGASICDFQVKGDLALCLFVERPSLTRARMEKFADEDVIHYSERPFFALTEHAMSPQRKLLVHRGAKPFAKHEWRNLWLDCFTEVRRRIHNQYGFKPEVPLPTVCVFLWDNELKKLGRNWTKPMVEALATYKRLGFAELFTHGVWNSVTSDPFRADEGNICCPYEFRYAEQFGGAAGMKKLFDAAHAVGLKIYQWFGMQLSKHSPIWKKHPQWILREANGDPWDGNYQSLLCGRIRGGFGEYLEQSIRKVKDDTGLDSIFWDSYQNLGVTCVDWQGPDKAPQADEIWVMQARLQRYGFKQRCEVVTIFGVSQVGMYGFDADEFRRRLWDDTVRNDDAFALFDCSPGFFTTGDPFTAEKLKPDYYFWLAAHRAIPNMGAYPWNFSEDSGRDTSSLPGGSLVQEYAAVNHQYNSALPFMHRLRVTEGGHYTLWLDQENQPAVVWAFRNVQVPFSGWVTEIRGGERQNASGTFTAEAGKVYLLGDRQRVYQGEDREPQLETSDLPELTLRKPLRVRRRRARVVGTATETV